MRNRKWCLAAAFVVAAAGTAMGQTIQSVDFEDFNTQGWAATGDAQVVGGGGNPGNYLGVPYSDWYWVTLLNDVAGSPVTGDLTRHGGALTFAVDIQVPRLDNWNNEPMDPGNFPLVIQFVDATDPLISVYFVGPGMPSQSAGWQRYSFDVPNPSQSTLPAGWGGTGDENPQTGEPRLPVGRTYDSVMRNVGEVRFTTAVPGYFYIPSFWEVGFDNITVSRAGGTCFANCDGSTGTPELNVNDFVCFQSRFAAGEPYADCNHDSALNVNDFICFQSAFAAGCR